MFRQYRPEASLPEPTSSVIATKKFTFDILVYSSKSEVFVLITKVLRGLTDYIDYDLALGVHSNNKHHHHDRKYKESAHMSLVYHPVSQPSLDIPPIWTPIITAEVRKCNYVQCRLYVKDVFLRWYHTENLSLK
jgi:hypothetical protein